MNENEFQLEIEELRARNHALLEQLQSANETTRRANDLNGEINNRNISLLATNRELREEIKALQDQRAELIAALDEATQKSTLYLNQLAELQAIYEAGSHGPGVMQ